MTACSHHRLRYRRLWRLPTLRLLGATALLGLAVAGAGAAVGPGWLPVVVLAATGAGMLLGARRRGAHLAVEARLVRALVSAGGRCPGAVQVPGLTGEVRATTGAGGVTRIEATTWADAVRGLGYAMGRDRAFQLDLLRRTARGRLAEVWGRTALPSDRAYRRLRLGPAAERATGALHATERALLSDFAEGVNAAVRHHGPPFESRFLAYRPEPWTVEDSVVIALYLFHGLSWNEPARRAAAVVRRAFPPHVAAFLLPCDGAAAPPLPVDLARYRGAVDEDVVAGDRAIAGSNCWVLADPERPVLACDLHLPLTLPNSLYEVDLRWGERRLRGLAAVGLPAVLTGENGDLAWGVTNLGAGVLDLLPVTEESTAWETEHIRVRGRPDVTVRVPRVATMPVAESPLLGAPVAARWTGHHPLAADLRFSRLAHAADVAEGIAVLDEAQGIALNVLLADARGRSAHLATGLLPRRPPVGPASTGGDAADGGPAGRAGAVGEAAPEGPADRYLTGAERPRSVDPPSGILVSANDAALPQDRFRIGFDQDPGHRARRIRRVLTTDRDPAPAAMRALQRDTVAELYEPYREVAVAALREHGHPLAESLADWDGRADPDSRAFGLLVTLRETLARRVLSPYLSACRELDPGFRYAFRGMDRPLLAIIRSGDAALLPPGEEHGWSGFLVTCVEAAAEELSGPGTARSPRRLPRWGRLNAVGLHHPMTVLAPWAGRLLGVAARPQPGALHTVRAGVPGFAAVGRAVLTPGADGVAADFELPAGQSGHPLSPHYADRHRRWAAVRTPTADRQRPEHAGCTAVLRPAVPCQRQKRQGEERP